MSDEDRYKVLVITQGCGCHAEMEGWSVSGMYDKPEVYIARVEEGGAIVDQRPVKNITRAVIQAPLLRLELADEEVDTAGADAIEDSLMAQAMMSEPGNGFGQILRHELIDKARRPKRKYSSMAFVGLGCYLDYWREQGARIGRVVEGEVVWE